MEGIKWDKAHKDTVQCLAHSKHSVIITIII